MYVIVVYDVGEKRVGKMLKLCRQYLCWIQNSVFNDQSEDSIIIFTNKIGYNMDKQILGKERMSTDNFL